MKKILTLFGTRPEAIKLAPVILEIARYPNDFLSIVGVSGQHTSLLDSVLETFSIKPDFNLKVMKPGRDLTGLTADILLRTGAALDELKPDLLIVQGDTTTVFASALAAFYRRIPIAHVEAGLRTADKYQPFPEEINRRLTDEMADYFFAPTHQNRERLLAMSVPEEKIFVTGNTVVDALKFMGQTKRGDISCLPAFSPNLILVTAHRRENFGHPMIEIFQTLQKLAGQHPDYDFACPVHPNPNVKKCATDILADVPNVHLLPPLSYDTFLLLMQRARFILSDSGGIQEEASSFNKPLLILRNKTERPEIVDAGGALLTGTDGQRIQDEVNRLIIDREHYNRMASVENPFGDGRAAERIISILRRLLLGTASTC